MTPGRGRIYITNHDGTVNFSAYKTYSIVDSAALIGNYQFSGIWGIYAGFSFPLRK
jgi:hypothetical protein